MYMRPVRHDLPLILGLVQRCSILDMSDKSQCPCLCCLRTIESMRCVLQTPISIWQRIQKDGAGALKEILPKTKMWIPGNGGLQAYKQARTHTNSA